MLAGDEPEAWEALPFRVLEFQEDREEDALVVSIAWEEQPGKVIRR